MLKSFLSYVVNRSKFIAYIYHPAKDLLLKTTEVPYRSDDGNGMIGCYLLFWLMRHSWAMSLPRLDDIDRIQHEHGIVYHCGWCKLECIVSNILLTQSRSTNNESKHPLPTSPVCVKTKEFLDCNRSKFIDEL